jgi:hypothetical protein
MMKRSFLRSLAILLGIATFTLGATASDVTSSKNELLMKGASPHLRFVNDNGNDYSLTVIGDSIRSIMRVNDLDGDAFFNVPPTGTIGIELNAPTSVMATPAAGGSLTFPTTYFFVVTALDGFGETVASSEVTCLTTALNRTCQVSWTAVAPPAQSYRVYMGTGSTLENSYDDVLVGTTYNATTDPLPNPGTPPAATTAYFIRMAPDGIHYSDGSVQSSAGGAAAWQIPPTTTNIVSAQSGNVGIGPGTVFVPDAKLTVLGVVDIDDKGAIKALATNNFQFRSNYKNSTDRLWNTGQSSWAIVAGDGGDEFAIYRAPATVGAPAFASKLLVTSTVLQSQNFSATFGASTASAGSYTFQGSNVDVNISAGTGGTASLNFNVNAGKGFVLSADGTNTQFDFSGTLSFNAPVGGAQVASISPSGLGFFSAGVTTNGDVSAAGRVTANLQGHNSCNVENDAIFSAATNLCSTAITTGGGRTVITFTAGGYCELNDGEEAAVYAQLIQDGVTILAGNFPQHCRKPSAIGGGVLMVPWSASRQTILSSATTGTHSYNVRLTSVTISGSPTLHYNWANVGLQEMP